MSKAKQGPNVRRLICEKMAKDAVPDKDSFEVALSFLTNPTGITDGAKLATGWVNAAIWAVRNAVEPNPWKDADDETIAAEILKVIEARRKSKA